MSVEISPDMSEFFRERLVEALDRHRVKITEETELYLVHLLTDYANVPANRALSRPLVERLAAALEAGSDEERYRLYRDLGDSALYACGFFSDNLERRGIARGYVVAMGGRAYVAAGDLAQRRNRQALAAVYPELADSFDGLARALDDVRETTALKTPQDIVRLYERWKRTGSPLLAERLEEEGVFPQAPAKKMLH